MERAEARAFYEIETVKNAWVARELERQIASLLFERLALSTDKNDAVVKYMLASNQRRTIFASRYKLHLPTEAELKAELRREVKLLSQARERS